MGEDSIRKRKESKNGSTGFSEDSKAEDKQRTKATVLQKDVSMCVYLFFFPVSTPEYVWIPEKESH